MILPQPDRCWRVNKSRRRGWAEPWFEAKSQRDLFVLKGAGGGGNTTVVVQSEEHRVDTRTLAGARRFGEIKELSPKPVTTIINITSTASCERQLELTATAKSSCRRNREKHDRCVRSPA